MNSSAPVIVFGEGSSAVFLISQLVKRGDFVVWASGSGGKLLPVMPCIKNDRAMALVLNAQSMLPESNFAHPVETGIFHRVFRNKGFKPPQWKPSLKEAVWKPEQIYLSVPEFKASGTSVAQVEQNLRDFFETHPQVKKVESAPVIELEIYDEGGKIQFANGFLTEFTQFYFCDSLAEIKSIPKLSTVLKHQLATVKLGNLTSALQVVFQHSKPIPGFEMGLVIPMNRDAGESFDRDVLGYFMEPTRSVWTVFLQANEIEENHEIMKKLRKLKQSLNRAFDSPEFLPEGVKEFMATVEKEQVRFEDGYLATDGHPKTSSANTDFVLLSDAFGLTESLSLIADRFGVQAIEFNAEQAATESTLNSIEEVEMPSHLQNSPDLGLNP